ncbi:1-acyl-sn-glycerol-3-phosphate acyltransferase [Brumimicrobium mesophilum]|uniref:1-acyl-sn-glycerol-3-phosphate acyltransferase n=1 Tax=Brumimicrobium mesophilum TaxID=392717 RepID=UPI000D1442AD|nr:1-acyl-sn-glycerol-3-phosphate acyltransferase [Brumimicrobium mesophilum]
MLYRILKFIIGVGIRLYYKEIRVNNRDNLANGNKPMIIIANHPNTLMDAWVIGMVCKQPIYYMAKATLFDSKFKLKLLRSLNMIPINRKGEGITEGVDNNDSLSECYKVLAEGKTLVIFPEGTSYKEKILRELKTGTARIALETEKLNGGKLDLQIVAVGINYSQPEKFRSNILIDIDQPRGVMSYYELYITDKRKAVRNLTDQFRNRLEKVLVTTETKEEEELLDEIYKVLNTKYIASHDKGVQRQVNELKDIKSKIDELKLVQPWRIDEIKQSIKSMDWKLEKMRVRADFLDRKFRSRLFLRQILTSLIFILVALPMAVFGVIHNIFQYLFTDWLVPKLSKDIEYYAPLAILVGIVLYPLTYSGFAVTAHYVFNLSWLGIMAYLILMPLMGIFTYWFFKYLKHISYKWRYMFLMFDQKETLHELQKEKKRMKELLFED